MQCILGFWLFFLLDFNWSLFVSASSFDRFHEHYWYMTHYNRSYFFRVLRVYSRIQIVLYLPIVLKISRTVRILYYYYWPRAVSAYKNAPNEMCLAGGSQRSRLISEVFTMRQMCMTIEQETMRAVYFFITPENRITKYCIRMRIIPHNACSPGTNVSTLHRVRTKKN